MSSDEKNERGSGRTPWYADPAAKATYSILGVGISLSALLLFVGLWVLSGLNPKPEGDPPVMSDEGERHDQKEPESETESPNNTEPDGPTGSANSSERDASATVSRIPMSENQDVRLSAETDFSQLIQGRRIRFHESVHARHPVYLVGESVTLSDDAIIRAPQIWIFSDSVTGGKLDVSGTDGTAAPKDGGHAGSIYIVAQSVMGVDIMAIGGNGSIGDKGSRGGNGRDGDCRGFGGWEPAQRGGNGGPGGTGGRGGNGGSVQIIYGARHDRRAIDLSQGKGGDGGPGGDPGSGGDGCVGLGGAQSDAAAGSPGSPGSRGPDGDPGDLITEPKPRLVADILAWLRKRREILTVSTLEHVRSAERTNSTP